MAQDLPARAELPGVVDHGLDPRHRPRLVAQLQPAVLDALLDPRTGDAATGETGPVGDDLESGAELAAGEIHDLLGAEAQRAVTGLARVRIAQAPEVLNTCLDVVSRFLGGSKLPLRFTSTGKPGLLERLSSFRSNPQFRPG